MFRRFAFRLGQDEDAKQDADKAQDAKDPKRPGIGEASLHVNEGFSDNERSDPVSEGDN